MKPRTLDPRPARQLTDRECAKILGGMIGGLLDTARPDDVRAAVQWWAETNEAWQAFAVARELAGKEASFLPDDPPDPTEPD